MFRKEGEETSDNPSSYLSRRMACWKDRLLFIYEIIYYPFLSTLIIFLKEHMALYINMEGELKFFHF